MAFKGWLTLTLSNIDLVELAPGAVINIGFVQVNGRVRTATAEVPNAIEIREIEKRYGSEVEVHVISRSTLLDSYIEYKKTAFPPLAVEPWRPIQQSDSSQVVVPLPICRKNERNTFDFIEGIESIPSLLQVVRQKGLIVLKVR